MTPPLALISSNVISATSLSDVSEIAIVPDSECRTPTLIGALPCAKSEPPGTADNSAEPAAALMIERRDEFIEWFPPEDSGARSCDATVGQSARPMPCSSECVLVQTFQHVAPRRFDGGMHERTSAAP